jgi:hypothetical protein
MIHDVLRGAALSSTHWLYRAGCDGSLGPCALFKSDDLLMELKAQGPFSVPTPWQNKGL